MKVMVVGRRPLRSLILGTTLLVSVLPGISCTGCGMIASKAKPCCRVASTLQSRSQGFLDRSMACCRGESSASVAVTEQSIRPRSVMTLAAAPTTMVEIPIRLTQASFSEEDPPRFDAIGLFTRYSTFLI